jgi:IS6 family transposase
LHLPPGSAAQAGAIDEQATEPLMTKTRKASKPAPRVINVEKNAAYPRAIADLKAIGVLPESVELRQINSLNNLIEQDHRAHQTPGQSRVGLLFG